MAIDPAWIALIGTLAGGVGLKFAEHWLGRSKVKVDEASKIRDELRLEITAQRQEIKDLETEADKWKKEYYDLREKYMTLQTELTLALQQIRQQAITAEGKASEISEKLPPPLPPPP
jgi:uncharacterized coiled-coil DUF342 family protein